MGFKCGRCDARLTNKSTRNHLTWKCRDAEVFCLSCDRKLNSTEFLKHKSCVPKGADQGEAMKQLVFKVLEKSSMKTKFRKQLRQLVKTYPVPTSKANINKFVYNKLKTQSPVFKTQAKDVFLTAAGMLPKTPSAARTRCWHNECKKLMLSTLEETETTTKRQVELENFLKTVKSPKIWSKFVEFINKPDRFSSSKVVKLATRVFQEASQKFPPKPSVLEVGKAWQALVLDTLRTTDASEEEKDVLEVIIRKRTVPKSKTDFSKYLNHPNRLPTVELKTLLEKVYSEATASKKIVRAKRENSKEVSTIIDVKC